jgi:hypothetical protein
MSITEDGLPPKGSEGSYISSFPLPCLKPQVSTIDLKESMMTTEDGVSPGGVREDILTPSLSPLFEGTGVETTRCTWWQRRIVIARGVADGLLRQTKVRADRPVREKRKMSSFRLLPLLKVRALSNITCNGRGLADVEGEL